MTSELQPALPTGTVTFLFTDIAGSTPLWERYPDAMQTAVARHHAILHTAAEAHNGHVFKIVGDEFQIAFELPAQERGRTRDLDTTVAQLLAELAEQEVGDNSP